MPGNKRLGGTGACIRASPNLRGISLPLLVSQSPNALVRGHFFQEDQSATGAGVFLRGHETFVSTTAQLTLQGDQSG